VPDAGGGTDSDDSAVENHLGFRRVGICKQGAGRGGDGGGLGTATK